QRELVRQPLPAAVELRRIERDRDVAGMRGVRLVLRPLVNARPGRERREIGRGEYLDPKRQRKGRAFILGRARQVLAQPELDGALVDSSRDRGVEVEGCGARVAVRAGRGAGLEHAGGTGELWE